MASYKKKIVALLGAIALCSGVTFVYSSQSATNEGTKPLFNNSDSRPESQPGLSAGTDDNFNTRELFFKMMFMILLVVVLGTAVVYISKKFLPGFTHPSGKRIRIIETVHLGPRRTVHLLKIGNRQLLVGSTSESITKLADVTNEPSEKDLPATVTDNN
jgi:flagellar biosynthetic protein FliO